MANIQINISDNGTTTLATAGKYCDRNVDVVVDVAGGGGGDLPPEAFHITGNCSRRFAYNGWNWFIENYGSKITTENITDMNSMFVNSSEITNIPFTLNIKDGGCDVTSAFYGCNKLQSVASIDFKCISQYKGAGNLFTNCNYLTSIGTLKNLFPSALNNMFQFCYRLRELPSFENLNLDRIHSYSYASVSAMFSYCYSLRNIPSILLRELYTAGTVPSYQIYNMGFFRDYALDELVGLPINETTTILSNVFLSTFTECGRLKSIVFDTNDDGSAKTVKWKSQTIDLVGSGAIGSDIYILGYNSGITLDTKVTDDTTYQSLKDNPDWWTTNKNYSRYNHDSAVETINSLPDTSAYLATSGGTNTIKFSGAAGALTDGGAINTLTAEEIAVATAKGWTVSLV